MRRFVGVFVLALLLANPADISSCGPFLPGAIFTRAQGPDEERAFFAGHFGILQPAYERRYLAMAYRILSGEPLNDTQRAQVTDLERFRMGDANAELTKWLAARKKVHNARPIENLEWYKRAPDFSVTPTCGADAFASARTTLAARVSQAGADSAEVRDWLNAQDTVFGDCAGGAQIPEPPPAGASERIRADRAYQIAAANFYAGNFDAARAQWRDIAADAGSPWHVSAPYLIARADLRESKYKEAEAQLKTVLGEKSETPVHHQARDLLDYARAHLDPAAQMLAVSQRLMQPASKELGHDLNDYTFLYDLLENGSAADFRPGQTDAEMQNVIAKRWKRLQTVADGSDLTAWVLEFQSKDATRHEEVKRWRETKSTAWLLAAANAYRTDEDGRDILAALRVVPAASPAFATARFMAARILIDDKQPGEAAALLDEVLRPDATAGFDASTLNALHAERMRVARTFDEFLANAPRLLKLVADEGAIVNSPQIAKREMGAPVRAADSKKEPGYSLDTDAAVVFNTELPMSMWLGAVRAQSLPASVRGRLAQAGWVRATVLGDSNEPFAEQLAMLKPSYAASLAGFARLPAAEQRFAGVFWILHHPELRPYADAGLPRQTGDGHIDEYRQNWWCGAEQAAAASPIGGSPILRQIYGGPQPKPAAAFLNAEEQKANQSQQTKVSAAGDGPTFLATAVIQWVHAHPGDARNPEALALVVKAGHYGCPVATKRAVVGQAFRLLHERYGKTTWAESTKYWY